MLILVILMGGLGMIWSPYGFFGLGGLTKLGSDGIMRAKTAAPPTFSDTFSDNLGGTYTFSDTFGHTHSIVNNLSYSFSLYITLTYIFYYI